MANGLLSRAKKPAPADDEDQESQASPTGQDMDSETDEGEAAPEGEQATPEEQAQYELFVGQCLKLIYGGGKVNQAVLDRLKTGKPVQALAAAATVIVDRVFTSAKENGKDFAADILLHAGKEILQDLAELAQKSGIHDYTQDELDGAFYAAVDQFRADHQGMIDQNAAKGELQQLQQADQQGKLGQMLPGIEKFKAPAPAPEGAPNANG